MTFTHKLARRLAVLRALPPHCAMLSALALITACSAGSPTGVDTSLNPADAPVIVNPRSLILEANQVSVFKAYAQGVPGDSLVTSIEWTATGGTIALNGTYSSPSTGDFKVVGKRHGPTKTTSDTATVTVVSPQPTITSVVVSPSSASVTTGTQQTFTATGKLSDGSTVAIGVTWTATGGNIDAGGVYTAGTTTGTYHVIAQAASANVADTVPVTVTATAVTVTNTGSGAYANQPASYARFAEHALNGTGTSPGAALAGSFGFANLALGSQQFASNSSEPISPPSILSMQLGIGTHDGAGPAGVIWTNYSDHHQVYMAWTMRIEEPTYEAKVYPGTKIALIGYGGSPNAGVWEILSNGIQFGSAFQIGFIQQNNVTRQMNPNVNTANLFTTVAWHKIEAVLIANTIGSANGVFKMWIDGVQTHNYTDVTYLTSNTQPFFQANWEWVWGGSCGGCSRTTTNTFDFGHVYLSGIN